MLLCSIPSFAIVCECLSVQDVVYTAIRVSLRSLTLYCKVSLSQSFLVLSQDRSDASCYFTLSPAGVHMLHLQWLHKLEESASSGMLIVFFSSYCETKKNEYQIEMQEKQ